MSTRSDELEDGNKMKNINCPSPWPGPSHHFKLIRSWKISLIWLRHIFKKNQNKKKPQKKLLNQCVWLHTMNQSYVGKVLPDLKQTTNPKWKYVCVKLSSWANLDKLLETKTAVPRQLNMSKQRGACPVPDLTLPSKTETQSTCRGKKSGLFFYFKKEKVKDMQTETNRRVKVYM